MLAHVTDRAVMLITGSDVSTLLQGLITNNVRLLDTQPALFSALLSPQGKFLYDFFLVNHSQGMLLETEARQLEGLMALLTKYRLRAKVQFTPLPQWQVYAGWDEEPPVIQDAVIYTDARHEKMGWRVASPHPIPTSPQGEGASAYHVHRINIGIPEGWHDLQYDKSFVMEYGYDALHAIDFTKGCYVGQEVTARTKYRGVVRKKIVRVQAVEGLLPESDALITTEAGVKIGEMRSYSGAYGLALCRAEEMQALTAGTALYAGTCAITLYDI